MKKLTVLVLSLGLALGSFAQMTLINGNGAPVKTKGENKLIKVNTVKSATPVKADQTTLNIGIEQTEENGNVLSVNIEFADDVELYDVTILRQGASEQYVQQLGAKAGYFAYLELYYAYYGETYEYQTVSDNPLALQQSWMLGNQEYEVALVTITGEDTVLYVEPFETPKYTDELGGIAEVEVETDLDVDEEQVNITFTLNDATYGAEYLFATEDYMLSAGLESAADVEDYYQENYSYFSSLRYTSMYLPINDTNATWDEWYVIVVMPYNGNNENGQPTYHKFNTYKVGLNAISEYTINVYPNPTSEVVKLNSAAKINNVQLINTLGQVVYTSDVNAMSTSINVANLPKGSYLLKANTDASEMSTMVIVR